MKSLKESPKLQLSRKAALASLSLALYWGCALLAAAVDAVSIGQNNVWQPLAGFIGVLASLAVFGAIPHHIASKAGGRVVRALILLGPLTGVATVLAQLLGSDGLDAIALLSRALLGVSLGFVLAHLGSFLAHQKSGEGTVLAIAAFLLGSVLFMACSRFILTYGGLIISCLSLVSAVAFLLAGFDEQGLVHALPKPSKAAADRLLRLPKGFWPLFMDLFFYSVVYGIVIPLTLDVGGGAAHSTPIALVLLAPGLVLLFAEHQFQEGFDFRRFQWFLFAPSILALLILPFAGREVSLGCCALLIMVFSFFDLASFILLVNLARNRSAALTMRIFAWGRLANIAGMAAGWGSASVFLGSALDRVEEQAIPAFLAVVILVILMTFFGNSSIAPAGARSAADERSAPQGTKSPDLDAICEELAQAHGLSSRESEMFKLLARGRSSTYIADALCVAPSTVKTHANRIYRKLDVHSRQALIDLVENYPLDRKDEECSL